MTKKTATFSVVLLAALSVAPAKAAQPAAVVFFTLWSALLDDAASSVVEQAASQINASQTGIITVTGYADISGSAEANSLLAKLRAQLVIDQLVADGVSRTRLKRADRGATPDIGGANESRRVLISFEWYGAP